MNARSTWRWVCSFGLVLGCGLVNARAFAQGCASCYTTAAASGPQTAHALRLGIVVLLVPPVLIFAGIVSVLRRWNHG